MPRDPRHDVLFEPLKIGPKVTPNRFFQVPHCNNAGTIRPGAQAAFRATKAEGGWGTVCVEFTAISPETDDSPHICARIWDEGDVINLRHTAESVHAHGALAGIQLWHGGGHVQARDSLCITRGPSAYVSEAAYQNYCYECDEDDISELIEQYVLAAKRAVDAGFDYIEIIGSESSLPAQFLMPMYNKRADRWGGSLENRARFWIEVLAAVKGAVGDNAAIGTRVAIDNLMGPAGMELEGEGLRFVELVTREGVADVWNIKLSFFMEWGNDAGPSRFFKAGYQTWATKAVKAVANVPVIGVNRVTEPDAMVRMIEDGALDLIGAARPSIADPFLPKKIDEGRPDDIRECIGCNICVSQFALDGPPLVCTQNATAMEEYRRGWHPEKFTQTSEPCSVLVVGAGPAGLECARVLGMRGYDVHLREAEGEVGGHIRDVSRYPGLSEWGRVVSYRENQIAKLANVELHTGVGKMTADDILTYGADKVVVAVGAHWATDGASANDYGPAVGGVDASLPQFCTPEQIMAGKETGERVVVLDGDGYFTGVGMAEYLADQGKTVSMVTQFGEVAPYTILTLEAPNLQRQLHDKGIKQHLLHWVEAVDVSDDITLSLAYAYRDGAEFTMPPKAGTMPRRPGTEVTKVECDSVVLVTSRVSHRELFAELKVRKAEWAQNDVQAIYETGDGQTPRFIQMSIFEGHRIAREFESANPQKPLDYIRERQIWGQDAYPSLDG
jgi:dimethylamine/trimethylamine dehydrogenase